MKVILRKDVPGLGVRGDIKEVSDGYARNFLFAKKFAEPASVQAVKVVAHKRAIHEHKKHEEEQKYKDIVTRLASLVLHFSVRAGEKGKAFGSVPISKIIEELKKHKIEVEKDWLSFGEPLKSTGEKVIQINFPHNIQGEIKVVIEAGKNK